MEVADDLTTVLEAAVASPARDSVLLVSEVLSSLLASVFVPIVDTLRSSTGAPSVLMAVPPEVSYQVEVVATLPVHRSMAEVPFATDGDGRPMHSEVLALVVVVVETAVVVALDAIATIVAGAPSGCQQQWRFCRQEQQKRQSS